MLLPCLYYVSLLHSLVSRATIRQMLDDRLASEGVHKSTGSRSTGSVFVATYPQKDRDQKERSGDLEASTDHIVQVPLQTLEVCPILCLTSHAPMLMGLVPESIRFTHLRICRVPKVEDEQDKVLIIPSSTVFLDSYTSPFPTSCPWSLNRESSS